MLLECKYEYAYRNLLIESQLLKMQVKTNYIHHAEALVEVEKIEHELDEKVAENIRIRVRKIFENG